MLHDILRGKGYERQEFRKPFLYPQTIIARAEKELWKLYYKITKHFVAVYAFFSRGSGSYTKAYTVFSRLNAGHRINQFKTLGRQAVGRILHYNNVPAFT